MIPNALSMPSGEPMISLSPQATPAAPGFAAAMAQAEETGLSVSFSLSEAIAGQEGGAAANMGGGVQQSLAPPQQQIMISGLLAEMPVAGVEPEAADADATSEAPAPLPQQGQTQSGQGAAVPGKGKAIPSNAAPSLVVIADASVNEVGRMPADTTAPPAAQSPASAEEQKPGLLETQLLQEAEKNLPDPASGEQSLTPHAVSARATEPLVELPVKSEAGSEPTRKEPKADATGIDTGGEIRPGRATDMPSLRLPHASTAPAAGNAPILTQISEGLPAPKEPGTASLQFQAPLAGSGAPITDIAGFRPGQENAAPVISTRPGRFGEELGVAIARHAGQSKDKPLEILTLRLDPPEHGRIEVRLTFEDGAPMRASVLASQPGTLDLLRRDSAELFRALGQAGIGADAQSFQFDSRSHQGQQERPSGPALRQHFAQAPVEQDGSAPEAADGLHYRPLRYQGAINLIT